MQTTVEPLTILLVEDNPAHAELVARSFEGHQIANRIYHVSDGEAALNYLFRQGEYSNPDQYPWPNLILLDIRLPRASGLEILKQIKRHKELQSIPVVILTTSAAERDVAGAYQAHANSYLVKPADFAEFSKLMDELGYYWLGWNHFFKR
jgi:CheY-like chemotaxis protein